MSLSLSCHVMACLSLLSAEFDGMEFCCFFYLACSMLKPDDGMDERMDKWMDGMSVWHGGCVARMR